MVGAALTTHGCACSSRGCACLFVRRCAWQGGTPSLFRIEGCRGNCRFGNIWAQMRPAPGFAGLWATNLSAGGASGTADFRTAGMDSPPVVALSDTLRRVPPPSLSSWVARALVPDERDVALLAWPLLR